MKQTLWLLIIISVFMSCAKKTTMKDTTEWDDNITQVIYFHTKKRCITCNAIEQLSKEVVDSLNNNKIIMRVIDISKNEAIADKYEVTWSSLILDKGGKTKNLTDMGFSFAKNQPQQFKAKLVEAITHINK